MTAQVCSPWVDPESLCCSEPETVEPCDGSDPVELSYPFTNEDYVLAASNILYARTGYRWPGLCTMEIWPCIDRCDDRPYPCTVCCAPDQVELPTIHPVIEASILEDGVLLDEAAWRIERGRFIVRLDGKRFSRNSFGIGSGVETRILFTHGRLPPPELRLAAHDLACELKRACSGQGDCRLPPNIRSIARQGLQIELIDLQRMLISDKTGIPSVDHALSVHGMRSMTSLNDPMQELGWGVS